MARSRDNADLPKADPPTTGCLALSRNNADPPKADPPTKKRKGLLAREYPRLPFTLRDTGSAEPAECTLKSELTTSTATADGQKQLHATSHDMVNTSFSVPVSNECSLLAARRAGSFHSQSCQNRKSNRLENHTYLGGNT